MCPLRRILLIAVVVVLLPGQQRLSQAAEAAKLKEVDQILLPQVLVSNSLSTRDLLDLCMTGRVLEVGQGLLFLCHTFDFQLAQAPPKDSEKRTQVRFSGPPGTKIGWYAKQPDGKKGFTDSILEVPGRYNFVQGASYRLKLSDIPNRPGVNLYPTLEVPAAGSKAAAFLAHNAVPLSFTDEDLDSVASGALVVKVVLLPDAKHQAQDVEGVGEVVSTRLEPGVDPVAEARRRGTILLVLRLGNIDLEAPGPQEKPKNK